MDTANISNDEPEIDDYRMKILGSLLNDTFTMQNESITLLDE